MSDPDLINVEFTDGLQGSPLQKRERDYAAELVRLIAMDHADTTPKSEAEAARAIVTRSQLYEQAYLQGKRPVLDAARDTLLPALLMPCSTWLPPLS